MASRTTQFDIPYPTHGDSVNEGADLIRALALAVETAIAGLDDDTTP